MWQQHSRKVVLAVERQCVVLNKMVPKEDFRWELSRTAKLHKCSIFFIDGSGPVYEREERGLSAVHYGFRLRGGANRSQTAEVQSSQRIKGASTGDLLSTRQDEQQQSNIGGLVVALVLSSAHGDLVVFNCHRVQA